MSDDQLNEENIERTQAAQLKETGTLKPEQQQQQKEKLEDEDMEEEKEEEK